MSYEVGRNLLPGLLCFVASAMYDKTERAQAVQTGLYFGAFISLGVFGSDRKPKDFFLPLVSAGAGYGLGQLYGTLTQ